MYIRTRTTVKTFLLLIAVICCSVAFSQLHQEVVNYSLNGPPANGVKIKANLLINFGVTSSGGYQPVNKQAVGNGEEATFIDEKHIGI